MKILIAEDEPISRRLMQRTLQQFGYEVVIAENGRKAAEILSAKDGPRLALIDWMMPELDGPELCRRIRLTQQDRPYIYIILLTSKQNSEDVVAGLESGADDYLVKPCAPAELKARLRTGRRILELEDNLVEAREEMRYRATHDSLTGLRNRAEILLFAQKALVRSIHRGNTPLMMLCDVDHFKQINDTYGHPAGDAVLEEVARRLAGAIRPEDAVGRYGGEEFLIILNDCKRASAQSRSDSIRQTIAQTQVAVAGVSLPVTMSIGSVLHEGGADIGELETMLAQADAALYRAKANGRNCVTVVGSIVNDLSCDTETRAVA
jgi:diguanylate cyclase (GGDEF)-like protein